MTRWVRSYGGTCGGCNRPVAKGELVQLLYLPEITDPKRRCQHCCDGPVPPELPADPAPLERGSLVTQAKTVFARIHRSHFERTMPLLVSREPGEEG